MLVDGKRHGRRVNIESKDECKWSLVEHVREHDRRESNHNWGRLQAWEVRKTGEVWLSFRFAALRKRMTMKRAGRARVAGIRC
jgi:hypothetical protein